MFLIVFFSILFAPSMNVHGFIRYMMIGLVFSQCDQFGT